MTKSQDNAKWKIHIKAKSSVNVIADTHHH